MNDVENRRSAPRLPFLGLRLEIKKRGIRRSAKYQECYSVDLSNGGLAFTSNGLDLSEREKVDFILIFRDQAIQGTALVRYVHRSADLTRYGLMFSQALPELDRVLSGENLTTHEIKHLAASMAEYVGYAIQETRDEKFRFKRQRQRFYDALNAYFARLSEMGVRLPAVHSNATTWKEALDAVDIDEMNGRIDFIRYSVDHDVFIEERIQIRHDQDGERLCYVAGNGAIFNNLFELLAYISDELSLVAKLAHFCLQTRQGS
jgi:PilZ domain